MNEFNLAEEKNPFLIKKWTSRDWIKSSSLTECFSLGKMWTFFRLINLLWKMKILIICRISHWILSSNFLTDRFLNDGSEDNPHGFKEFIQTSSIQNPSKKINRIRLLLPLRILSDWVNFHWWCWYIKFRKWKLFKSSNLHWITYLVSCSILRPLL